MFTVVFGWLASGNSSTLRPLPNVYSLMPSTDGPCLTPSGSAAAATPAATKNAIGASVRANQSRKRIMSSLGKRNGRAESLSAVDYRHLKVQPRRRSDDQGFGGPTCLYIVQLTFT